MLIKTEYTNPFIIENYIKFIKIHYEQSKKVGIHDTYNENYDEERFLLHNKDFDFYIIQKDNIDVGFLSIEINEEYDKNVVSLLTIYIIEEYRGKGYGTEAIYDVKNMTGKIIEIEAWYGLPVERLYTALGKEVAKIFYI
jgi:GNAT superfamily N-acetyltransferase